MKRFARLISPIALAAIFLSGVFALVAAQSGEWYLVPEIAIITSSQITGNEAGFNATVSAIRGSNTNIDWSIRYTNTTNHAAEFIEVTVNEFDYWCTDGCGYTHTMQIGPPNRSINDIVSGDTLLIHNGSQADRCGGFTYCKDVSNPMEYLIFKHRLFAYKERPTTVNMSVSVVIEGLPVPGDNTQPPGTHPAGGVGTCYFTETLVIDDPSTMTETIGISNTGDISVTGDIGGTDPITVDIPYTRTINLVSNPSFESGGSAPTDWDKYVDGTIQPGSWSNWMAGVALSGDKAVQSNGGAFDFLNDVSLRGASNYAVGFHARCTDENPSCSESASIYWGQMIIGGSATPPLASGSPISTTYTQISGTKASGGGVAMISIKTTGSDIYVDDIFLYPIDDNGAPLCDPSLYEPPDFGGGDGGGDGGGTIPNPGGLPIPVPGGGLAVKCYECSPPTNMFSIGGWLAWLACHIRNLFTCQLRIWIYNLLNLLMGFFRAFWVLLNWLVATAQNFANWLFSTISDVVGWGWIRAKGWVSWAITEIGNILGWVWAQWQNAATWFGAMMQDWISWFVSLVNGWLSWLAGILDDGWSFTTGWVGELWAALIALPGMFLGKILNSDFLQNWWARLHWLQAIWDAAKLLMTAFMEILKDLYAALIRLIEMLINVFQKLRDAFVSNPYEITIVTSEGEISTIEPGALYADGPNGTKILWMFLAGVSTVDWFIGEFGLEMVLALVVGTLAIGIIFWTLRLWHEILPI